MAHSDGIRNDRHHHSECNDTVTNMRMSSKPFSSSIFVFLATFVAFTYFPEGVLGDLDVEESAVDDLQVWLDVKRVSEDCLATAELVTACRQFVEEEEPSDNRPWILQGLSLLGSFLTFVGVIWKSSTEESIAALEQVAQLAIQDMDRVFALVLYKRDNANATAWDVKTEYARLKQESDRAFGRAPEHVQQVYDELRNQILTALKKLTISSNDTRTNEAEAQLGGAIRKVHEAKRCKNRVVQGIAIGGFVLVVVSFLFQVFKT